jgi:hypothetical protein
MKIEDCKVGMKVKDRWFLDYGVGTITKVLKTRIHVVFPNYSDIKDEICTYDKAHIQFMLEVKND